MIFISFIISFILSFTLWLLYLQFDTKIGNVWLRPDHNNNLVFCYKSIINMLKYPFQNFNLWKPKYWDLNYYVIFILTYLLIYFLKKDTIIFI